MYSFFTTHEKKARSFHNGQWRDVSNPLYQKDASERDEKLTPKERILRVYPIPYWHLGPDQLPHYQGTVILVFTQTDVPGLPRYLIWIDRVEGGDVLYAHDSLDLLFALHFLKEFVKLDLLTEIYQSSWYRLESILYS